jgi:hypothetical protein
MVMDVTLHGSIAAGAVLMTRIVVDLAGTYSHACVPWY